MSSTKYIGWAHRTGGSWPHGRLLLRLPRPVIMDLMVSWGTGSKMRHTFAIFDVLVEFLPQIRFSYKY